MGLVVKNADFAPEVVRYGKTLLSWAAALRMSPGQCVGSLSPQLISLLHFPAQCFTIDQSYSLVFASQIWIWPYFCKVRKQLHLTNVKVKAVLGLVVSKNEGFVLPQM